MHHLTKFISVLTICFLASVSCYANDEKNIPHNLVEMKWYEAKTNYNRIFDESIKARINEVACEQKLDHCDPTIKSSHYYPKAIEETKGRLKAAEKELYEKLSLEFNADNVGVQKD